MRFHDNVAGVVMSICHFDIGFICTGTRTNRFFLPKGQPVKQSVYQPVTHSAS
ncbi:hypothetical protein E2C01_084771 [Portunus trituberculatus]|uniref:Uncharacterized protein n=1 Tax=Portunus trituberculatus TaxID=210409 RepID=A0A5B7IW78_PORTR|nr:hypothetical protein [Portunus trituberculatus]